MNQSKHGVLACLAWLVGLLALVAGCKSVGMGNDTARDARASADTTDANYGSPENRSASSDGAAATAERAAKADSMASIANGTVTGIETVSRQTGDTQGTTSSGATGASTAGARTASGGLTADQVYRITLRMDDGTVRMVTQETMPTFSTGDRVTLSGDAIVR